MTLSEETRKKRIKEQKKKYLETNREKINAKRREQYALKKDDPDFKNEKNKYQQDYRNSLSEDVKNRRALVDNLNNKKRRRKNPLSFLVNDARKRAKKNNLDFDLEVSDFELIEFCPILGIKLEVGSENIHSSYSLDRIDNTLGYTKNNVKLISRRANTIKGDSSISEIKSLIEYIKNSSSLISNIKNSKLGSDLKRKRIISDAKRRAKKHSLAFNISYSDISIPLFCPVFNTPLSFGTRTNKNNSPSLDRIDNSKGYIVGNICIISYRANAIKNSATLEELYLILKYMEDSL